MKKGKLPSSKCVEGALRKIFSWFSCNTCKSCKNGLPCWSFPVLAQAGGCETAPLPTRIRLVSWGPAAVNGSHVGGCLRGVRLSPPRVISAWWPRPRRHQRVANEIHSHSAVTWRNGNQCRRQRERGRGETESEWAIWSAHVFIYLTLWTLQDPQKTIAPLPPPPYSHRILMQAAAVTAKR